VNRIADFCLPDSLNTQKVVQLVSNHPNWEGERTSIGVPGGMLFALLPVFEKLLREPTCINRGRPGAALHPNTDER
jgi:hypothetical protein